MDLRVREYESDGAHIVEVAGEVELNNATQLRAVLRQLCDSAPKCILVEMTEVTFIDSTGIGVLVGALKRARENDISFALICPQPRVRRIFEITGLLQALPLYQKLDEAMERCASDNGTAGSGAAENPGDDIGKAKE